MTQAKTERVRCPVHNLIEFDGTNGLERTLWRVIQTPPFQRLRRIRQLGFSEFVFPGATHTRFSHSLGVFHIARSLMKVIRRHIDTNGHTFSEHRANVALAAALLHDIGHGMFSHAFEPIGKEFGLKMAQHERVSEMLIRDSEVSETLTRDLGSGFANDVATLIGRKEPGSLYDAVVSSQFDADRLDYMQRDRLMTGVQSSGVDPTWLLANLQVAEVSLGADRDSAGKIETLILGPKAERTAESYVLGLFHLYPNVYLHKTTRGAEMLFGGLIRRLLRLGRSGHSVQSGLPQGHPLVRFIEGSSELADVQALDDFVFWGALPMMVNAADEEVRELAHALDGRHLLRCIDIRIALENQVVRSPNETFVTHQARITLASSKVRSALQTRITDQGEGRQRLFLDSYTRPPYKSYDDSQTPLSRILISPGTGRQPQDIAEKSPMIAGAEPFHIFRAYTFRDDNNTIAMIQNEIGTAAREAHRDHA